MPQAASSCSSQDRASGAKPEAAGALAMCRAQVKAADARDCNRPSHASQHRPATAAQSDVQPHDRDNSTIPPSFFTLPVPPPPAPPLSSLPVPISRHDMGMIQGL